jgi:hypothetical protein
MFEMLYVTTMMDGYGDLGHLTDYAKFCPDDDKRTFVLMAKPEKLETIRDKLSQLPITHPLFLHIEDDIKSNDKLKIFTNDEDAREYFRKFSQNLIIRMVSTQTFQFDVDLLDSSLIFNSGEHGLTDMRQFIENVASLSLLNSHLGFSSGCSGKVFIPTVTNLSENDLHLLPDDLKATLIGVKKEDFNLEVYLEKIKLKVVLPVYAQSQNYLNNILRGILSAPLFSDKEVVLFVTSNTETNELTVESTLKDSLKDKGVEVVLNKSYVSEHIMQIFKKMGKYIHPCSGDKSLEEAIGLGRIPIAEVKNHKRANFLALIKLIQESVPAGDSHKAKKDLIAFLSSQLPPDHGMGYRSARGHAEINYELLTDDVVRFWQNICTPYLRKHHDYSELVIRNESVSKLLFTIMKSTSKDEQSLALEGLKKIVSLYEIYHTVINLCYYQNSKNYHGNRKLLYNIINLLTEEDIKKVVELSENMTYGGYNIKVIEAVLKHRENLAISDVIDALGRLKDNNLGLIEFLKLLEKNSVVRSDDCLKVLFSHYRDYCLGIKSYLTKVQQELVEVLRSDQGRLMLRHLSSLNQKGEDITRSDEDEKQYTTIRLHPAV